MADGREQDEGDDVESLRRRVQELEEALALDSQVITVLKESEERLRTLLEHSPDTITVLDVDCNILYMNRTVPPYRLSDVLGTKALDYMPFDQAVAFQQAVTRAHRTGLTQTLEVGITLDRWWQSRLVPLEGQGSPIVMAIGTEITELRKSAEDLRRSEQMLRMAAEAARMGLWTVTGSRLSLDASTAAMLGLPVGATEMDLCDFEELVHEEDRPRARAAALRIFRDGALEDFEYRVLRKDGEVRWLSSSGKRDEGAGPQVRLIGSVFDLTEKKRLDEQLRHAQKMEAVGQLTAGVAHNFNNLLTAIIPSIQLARRQAPELARERLEDAEYAASRAAELVKQLMVFARQHHAPAREWLDVRSLVRRTVSICRATFDRRIALKVVEALRVPRVLGDAGQLEQVFLNICLNARDAVEAKAAEDGGRILIQIDAVGAEDESPEEWVRIRISDDGVGMPDGVRARVFEPFFTTKEVGRGTGLGLATASAIVAEAGGRIACESEVGRGTTFTIVLPAPAEGNAA